MIIHAVAIFNILLLVVWLYYRSRRPKILQPPAPASPQHASKGRATTGLGDVLVIGGNGNIGRRLVEILKSEKTCSTITVLDVSKGSSAGSQVRYIEGNICNLKHVREAVQGKNTVFHLASVIDLRSADRHWPRMYNVNVVGTMNVVESCIEQGVSALVYTSSQAARLTHDKLSDPFRQEVNATGENNILDIDPQDITTHYGRSKCLAEQYVVKANGRGRLRTAVVSPCLVFGFGDVFQYDLHLPCFLESKPNVAVVNYEKDKSIISCSYNSSGARLHVQAALALQDDRRRDEIGGQSFYQVDFHMDHLEFHRFEAPDGRFLCITIVLKGELINLWPRLQESSLGSEL